MEQRNIFQQFIKKEPYFHIIFWIMVLLFPYVKYLGKEGGYPNSILHEVNILVFQIITAYTVYYILLKGFSKGKLLLLVLIFVGCAYGQEYFDTFFHGGGFQFYTSKQIISHLITYATSGLAFFALYISKTAYAQQQKLLSLHEEKQLANMAALKAQVTPHFLFNTLNTIYHHAQKTDIETANLILKLADNTRYFLKEGQKDKVLLKEEIGHINNYIQLQKERWKDKIMVEIVVATISKNIHVAPLLFIPFVENAFKYTSQLRGKGHLLSIKFAYESEQLVFSCSNPFTPTNPSAEAFNSPSTGIGINNVRKRLGLIYPSNHDLKIDSAAGIYTVNLKLNV